MPPTPLSLGLCTCGASTWRVLSHALPRQLQPARGLRVRQVTGALGRRSHLFALPLEMGWRRDSILDARQYRDHSAHLLVVRKSTRPHAVLRLRRTAESGSPLPSLRVWQGPRARERAQRQRAGCPSGLDPCLSGFR